LEAGYSRIDGVTRAEGEFSEDERFMQRALGFAAVGRAQGEVPVGAIVVAGGEVVGEGWNRPIGSHDPTAHAEIVAIRAAAQRLGNYRLTGTTLYVTIEPCQMCVGAMVHARVARVVYGAPEPRAGAIESSMRAHEHPWLNHRLAASGGVLEAECRAMIQAFFAERRGQ
jgi:tRNA(adenine34) deaminase